MKAELYEYSNEEIRDFIDESEEPVTVCGITFNASRILEELDPIAFSMVNDGMPEVWVCGECGAKFEDEDDAEHCCMFECPECGN